jgi:hypothetical protein
MDKLDIRPFKIHIPDIDVADLSERIKRPDRHTLAGANQDFGRIFAGKDLAEWCQILDGNGLVFGVVGIPDDIPNDRRCSRNGLGWRLRAVCCLERRDMEGRNAGSCHAGC